MNIQGLWTALITPFTEKLAVDYDGLKQLIQKQIDANVDGILPLGTTGETPTLHTEEQKKIIEIARAQTQDRLPLMIGTGSYSTEQTIENTKRAEDLGADVALVVAPYYNKPTQRGLVKHFEALATACSIPVLVYNIQGRTGVNIQTDTLKEIAALNGIIGVKEASGNIEQMSEVISEIQNTHKNFSVLSGDDGLTFPLITLGGRGVVSVASNVIPESIRALVDSALNEDTKSARELHYCLRPLFQALFVETNPTPLKYVMNELGLPAGGVRLPLCEISDETKQFLTPLINELKNCNGKLCANR